MATNLNCTRCFIVRFFVLFHFHGYLAAVSQSLSHVQLFVHHGLQHARLLCPPLCPRICSDSGPLIHRSYVISSAASFTFCLQSFSESGSFPLSRLFTSCGQSMGTSTVASVLSMNSHCWLPLGLTDLIFLLSKWPSEIFSSTTI